MSKLIELKLDDDTVIYAEAQDSAGDGYGGSGGGNYRGSGRNTRGGDDDGGATPAPLGNRMDMLENTVRQFTRRALKPFKEIAEANIDKVKLEFGVTLGAEGGVPFITKGSAETTLKITVECSFKQKPEEE